MTAKVIKSEVAGGEGFSERSQPGYAFEAQGSSNEDGFSIGDVFRYLWNAKAYLGAGALAFLFAALLFTSFYSLVVPSVTSYRSSVTVTMTGAEPGLYPNGAAFAPSDLRSPAVLEAVFDANELSKYGLDLARFTNMVSVEAYSPVFNSTVERFRTRLDSKTLTFEERKSIEDEFRTAIAEINGKGILVTFFVPANINIDDVIALKVVNDIPAKWADVFINRLGVASLPIDVSGEKLVDDGLMKDLDYPLVYDYLTAQFKKLGDRIQSIEEIPGSSTILSKTTGKSISDLRRELESIGRFRLDLGMRPFVDLGLSRDKDLTSIMYSNLSSSLELEALANTETANNITNVLGDFRAKNNSNTGDTTAQTGVGSGVAPQGATTQIDGTMVDKIIELAKNGAGLDFQKELLGQKLDATTKNALVADQRRRLLLRLASLQGNGSISFDRDKITKEFESRATLAATNLNDLWGESNQFLEDVNMKRLNFDKKLYSSSDISNDLRISHSPWISLRRLTIYGFALLLGALAGLSLFAARRFLRNS